MPESVEADVEDSDTEKKREPLTKVFSPWASLDSIRDMLQSERETKPHKRNNNKHAMDAAQDLTHLLWGCDETIDPEASSPPSKDGSVGAYRKAAVEKSPTEGSVSLNASSNLGGAASLLYGGLTPFRAYLWFLNLCAHGLEMDTRTPRPRPNAEQRVILQRLIDRCLQERIDENSDSDFRSEPLRFMLHGVPGAGKSELLRWIRDFFETVCMWTHGK